jgi:hypothetical protein
MSDSPVEDHDDVRLALRKMVFHGLGGEGGACAEECRGLSVLLKARINRFV